MPEQKLLNERWEDIKGYEGLYQVSDLGRVKGLKRKVKNNGGHSIIKEKIKKSVIGYNKRGERWLWTPLWKNGKVRNCRISRLVAQAFIDNPNNYLEVDHIDRNTFNNNISNLRWANSSMQKRNSNRCDNSTSKYNGVCFDKSNKKWKASITINGRAKHIKSCISEKEAAVQFDLFCIKNNLDRVLNFGGHDD